ncbi:MAG: hypothetical protein IPI32_13310 [Austwickia sp.]|nr:hypothetical protein [Austwickia sp.]MBK8435207.1 hypothetical protein [Austwickia sp.]MBK9101240.1 hypothetical protein [Austwickia sp.]
MTPCPQCGSEEPGFYCRFCGTALSPATAAPTANPSDTSYTQPLGLPPQTLPSPPEPAASPPSAYQPTSSPTSSAPYSAPYSQPYEPSYAAHDWATESAAIGQPPAGPSARVLTAIIAVLATSLLALGLWWVTQRPGTPNQAVSPPTSAPTQADPAPSAPSASASVPVPPPTPALPSGGVSTTAAPTMGPTTGPTTGPGTAPVTPSASAPDPQQSLAELRTVREGSVDGLNLDGHWAAQLASKYDGVVDPLQTAGNGGHTFRYPDILAEYEQLRASHGESTILLNGSDFGRQGGRTKQTWVTLYDGGFASAQEARTWCTRAFPALTGQALANRCVPRALTAPSR